MTSISEPGIPADGKIVNNIIYFARALRRAGIAVGPDQIIEAIRAVRLVGVGNRSDMFWALHASFMTRAEHSAAFAQVFRLFWRDPRFLEHMMAAMLPALRGIARENKAMPGARRAAESLLDRQDGGINSDESHATDESEFDVDAAGTSSGNEVLRSMDFERMSAAESREAARVVARLVLPVPSMKSRRLRSDMCGRHADWRRTLQRSTRMAGHVDALQRQSNNRRKPDLVTICDISGSMSAYSRTILHFLHAVTHRRNAGWRCVHAFTFGTRLVNITRHMALREVDAALETAGHAVDDWDGGTRIGHCLREFNINWSRRVIRQGTVVILISDGLESGDTSQLQSEMKRLQLTAHRLIWLNPLLRWDGFAPQAGGIRAMMPHVDCFRAAHNIKSLAGLADAVANAGDTGERDRMMTMMAN